jgi:pyocin large subunit-like protein
MTAVAWRATALAALAASTILSGCGRDGAGTQARNAAVGGAAASAPRAGGESRYADARPSAGAGSYERDDAAARPAVPSFHGEPMWSDSRKYSAEENATYHFQRAGADLGAKTLDEFLTKVHHFIDHPPKDVQVITRNNGDRLLYDPKDNLFAVARADGAPRTIFKPTTGAAYWDEQKVKETARASGKDESRSYRRERYGDNAGGRAGLGGSGGQDGG